MSTSIRVTPTPNAAGWTCHVLIEEGGRTVSEHRVTLTTSDLKRLAPQSTVENLIKRSFDFLLEREPATSILRRFDLMDIERYFPEYPGVISG